MSFLKNRTVLGVICIVLSLIICFAVTPLFNANLSKKTDIIRVTKNIKAGEQITKDKVQTIGVGSFNLAKDVTKNMDAVIGKYTTADLHAGDYILKTKLTDEPTEGNTYLYNLNGEKQAISVTLKSFSNGLSGKLISGDIVSVIVPDYRKQGLTVIPPELQYMEVIAVTADTGYDTDNREEIENMEDKELPSTVTLLATQEQTKMLAELDANSKLHLSLVYRGSKENALNFIKVQDKLLTSQYPKAKDETIEKVGAAGPDYTVPEQEAENHD